MPKKAKEIAARTKKRLRADVRRLQKGGCTMSSDGSFDNLVDQLSCMVQSGVKAITTGIDTAYSVITLPGDLAWDMERPNEPLPANTAI